MQKKPSTLDLKEIKDLLDATGLSQLPKDQMKAGLRRGIFRAAASCDISCEKCSAGCITCSPGKSNPGLKF